MQFETTARDKEGNPTGWKFEPENDGGMEGQLDPRDFLAVKIGHQTEALIHEVNALRRENFLRRAKRGGWAHVDLGRSNDGRSNDGRSNEG